MTHNNNWRSAAIVFAVAWAVSSASNFAGMIRNNRCDTAIAEVLASLKKEPPHG